MPPPSAKPRSLSHTSSTGGRRRSTSLDDVGSSKQRGETSLPQTGEDHSLITETRNRTASVSPRPQPQSHARAHQPSTHRATPTRTHPRPHHKLIHPLSAPLVAATCVAPISRSCSCHRAPRLAPLRRAARPSSKRLKGRSKHPLTLTRYPPKLQTRRDELSLRAGHSNSYPVPHRRHYEGIQRPAALC